MSNIERGRVLAVHRTSIRLVPGGIPESPQLSTDKPLVVKPDFITNKLVELKNPSSAISFEEFKNKKFNNENPVEDKKVVNIEDYKKQETFHPHKKVLDKLANVNRILRRLRRGGRCLRTPHSSPEDCPTPSRCKMRGRTMQAAQKENKVDSKKLNTSTGKSRTK